MKIKDGLRLHRAFDKNDNLCICVYSGTRVVFICQYDFLSNTLNIIYVKIHDKDVIGGILNEIIKMGLTDDLRAVNGSKSIRKMLMRKIGRWK